MAKSQKERYEEITATIVAALERVDAGDWRKPWKSFGARNASTGRSYSGVNLILLAVSAQENEFASNEWLTFRQAKSEGGYVRKGEEGTKIVFFRFLDKYLDGDGNEVKKPSKADLESGRVRKKTFPLLRTFTVFNREQCEDLPEPEPFDVFARIEYAEKVVKETGADVRHGFDHAFFRPSEDFVGLPPFPAFESAEKYYSTLFHELGHWTGHSSRLNRDLSVRFGSEAYAFEELVAELTAAFVGSELGIEDDELRHHAEYVSSWIDILRDDEYAIFTAARKAQGAASFILHGAEVAGDDDEESDAA